VKWQKYPIESVKEGVEKVDGCNFFWLVNLVVSLVKSNSLGID